jgi:hypothetical protein
MRFDFSSVLKPRVFVGVIVIATMGLIMTCVLIELFMPRAASGDVVAQMTVIPAPTGTPLPPPTPTIDLNAPTATSTLAPGQIGIGSYVQIKGTDGLGLRIRSAPGLDGNPLFIAFDAEVFVVKEGPRKADGYTWYSLVAPYDESRTGWAASDFFTIIPPPEN